MPPFLTFPGWPVSRARAGPVRVQGDRFTSNLPPLWAIPSRWHLACKQGVTGSNPVSGLPARVPTYFRATAHESLSVHGVPPSGADAGTSGRCATPPSFVQSNPVGNAPPGSWRNNDTPVSVTTSVQV